MKVYFNRFEALVRKGGIDCFLIAGEEPWQRLAACDIVREYAGGLGYVRTMFFAGAGFDAGELTRASSVGNLFGGERRLLDLRIDGAVSSALSDVIKNYVSEPPQDTMLMIQAGKIDARKSWVKAVASGERCALLTTYNKTGAEFRTWLKDRIRAHGMEFEPEAEELFAVRMDGNLPAAMNALERIKLSDGAARVLSLEAVSKMMDDSSRFSVYDLADAAILGDTDRVVRVLHSLRGDNAPLPLMVWALTHKLRLLADGQLQGPPAARKVMQRALERKMPWRNMLYRCSELDATVKNSDSATAWESVSCLVLRICGVRI